MSFIPKTGRSCIAAALLVGCLATTATAEKWYVSYEKGVAAFNSSRWSVAVNHFNQAVADRKEAKANAKTYGMNFVDYVPYAYRGTAHAHLGNFSQASSDLATSKRYGAVGQAKRDKGAKTVLNRLETEVETLRKYTAAVALLNQGDFQGAVDGLREVQRRKATVPGLNDALARAETGLRDAKKPDLVVIPVDPKPSKEDLEADKKARQRAAQITRAFQRGVGFFDQGELDSAESAFDAVLKLDSSHTNATKYLGRIAAQRIRNEFQRGVNFFNRDELNSAESAFEGVLKLDSSHKEAKDYIVRISTRRAEFETEQDTAERIRTLAAEGKSAFDKGQLKQAKQKYAKVIALDRSHSESTLYLNRISQIEAKTKNGVTSFLAGDLDQSIQNLNQAADECRDEVVIYAVLACAYASKYFLSGEQDREHMRNAQTTFAKARKLNKNYKLKTKYVSPKIARMLNGN